MVAINERAASESWSRYYKWTIWTLILGIATHGVVTQGKAIAGIFKVGGSNGQITKLQFRLEESFNPSSVAWSPDGRYIATGSTLAASIHIWDVKQRRMVKELSIPYPAPFFHELSFSPDGRFLAACDGTGVLRIYYTGLWTAAHVFTELHSRGGCDHPVFSADSKQVATVTVRFLQVFSVPGWRAVKTVELDVGWGRGDFFNAIAYLPGTHTVLIGGGQYAAVTLFGQKEASWDGRVWFFDPDGQVPNRSIRAYRPGGDHGGGGAIHSLTTSPDGQYIVTGANTGAGDSSAGGIAVESVHVLGASDGRIVAAPLDDLYPSKFGGVDAIAYTHDGRYIVIPHDVADGWVHILDGSKLKVMDLVRSDGFNYDVAMNQVNDDFALGTYRQVIVWSLP